MKVTSTRWATADPGRCGDRKPDRPSRPGPRALRGLRQLEGLAIDTVNIDPSNALAALLDGEIDFAGFSMDSGLFTSLQHGVIDIRIVASQASGLPNANGAFMVGRKDLMDSGRVREFADLKGLTIAVSALGDSSEYVFAKGTDSAGLTLGDAKVVLLNVPATVAALARKSIDVGVLNEPWATVAEQNRSGD